MVLVKIVICLLSIDTITCIYGFSGEILPYSDPMNCADTEYFDVNSLKCVACNKLENLEPTTDSGLLINNYM
jgi:hypothetical protein